MGSGHFLVALVDWLADRVLEAMQAVHESVNKAPYAALLVERDNPYQSPVVVRLADIRRRILAAGIEHGWALDERQLDDRHIVRRMILKKVIFGVDKNPMAVELAKVALWLHTFTVGAPLSFLDHHLQCGDSLHGERFVTVRGDLQQLGVLFQEAELTRLEVAARSLDAVAELTDTSIAEAHESQRLADEAQTQVRPIHALLDFWRALRWLVVGWPTNRLTRIRDESAKRALAELLSDRYNLIGVISAGRIEGEGQDVNTANGLLGRTYRLSSREHFFHWWTAFPNVWRGGAGGFDAVIGNPPWDRIKLQQVEWFAERNLEIARQARAADRTQMIAALRRANDPLWTEYEDASESAENQARVVHDSGDYPMLGAGDVNLYSLFVERAAGLVSERGIVGLLTPSGIAADRGASEFFRSISSTGRLAALFDFENRNNPGGSYFPDVDSRFKFCALVFGGIKRTFPTAKTAFFLHTLNDLSDNNRLLSLSAEDFNRVNPNTGAAPIFRTRRDADLTTRIYTNHPVLVDRSSGSEQKVWPVRYMNMFHMTNDSDAFLSRETLEQQHWQPALLNRWIRGEAIALPLYEGKMVQMYDHRAADVVVNRANLHRAAQQVAILDAEKQRPDRYPIPQYWIMASNVSEVWSGSWMLAFKSITAPTNMRTMIAGLLPQSGVGNSMALLLPLQHDNASRWIPLLYANLTCFVLDFALRQKVQGQNLNWFIIEQVPVILPARFDARIGDAVVSEFIRSEVLALTYTAHDMAPFARDMGYINASGDVMPPFVWNAEDRRHRMARLDALFMHLYGLSKDDAEYILSTFPIVREKDEASFGSYRTLDLILAYMDRIAAGQLDHSNAAM